MGAFLALLSAVSYGISDYLGGLLSRRGSFARVALLGQLGGLGSLLLVATAPRGSRTERWRCSGFSQTVASIVRRRRQI